VLIGGTSNAGKSNVARVVASRLGYAYVSTDGLARHPGRPWRTPEREVPAAVAEHYGSLTVDELIGSVLLHYERLWPRVEALIRDHATEGGGPGLVLEGSALWPVRVATLGLPQVGAAWLAADEAVLRARIRAGGRYESATGEERHLMDKFLARTIRYQTLMLDAVERLGLVRIDAGSRRPVGALADLMLETVGARPAAESVTRRRTRTRPPHADPSAPHVRHRH
jgi:2-phosphoglycerate kinase